MNEKITIDDLYSDEDSFNQEAVLLTLKGKVIFTKEHEILFAIDPSSLKAREAILLYALAKKILKVNQKIDDEVTTSAEISDKADLKDNTTRGTITRLKEKNLLIRSGPGYEIPIFKVAEVLNLLNDNGD